jgi:hypothetical protein
MNIPNVRPKNSVRWPFRILASLIVAACVFGVIGNVFAGWPIETPLLKWQFLAALPGTAWLGRLAWHVAIHGRPPASPHWPFASDNVLFWYVVTFAVVSHA